MFLDGFLNNFLITESRNEYFPIICKLLDQSLDDDDDDDDDDADDDVNNNTVI